jgi:hypothetical protein
MMASETDDDELCELTNPITLIRSQIIEPISVFNYVQVICNVLWLVDDFMGNDADNVYKINLATQVLETCSELRQVRDCHWGCCESLLKLANNGKLNHLKKRIGYYEWIMGFITLVM